MFFVIKICLQNCDDDGDDDCDDDDDNDDDNQGFQYVLHKWVLKSNRRVDLPKARL